MSALAILRPTPRRTRCSAKLPVKGGVLIYGGAQTGVDDTGHAVPATADSDIIVLGKNLGETAIGGDADNSDGADGAIFVNVELPYERVEFFYRNDDTNPVAQVDVFRVCWSLDDQTVASTSLSGTLPIAGRVAEYTASGIWVEHTLSSDADRIAAAEDRIDTLETEMILSTPSTKRTITVAFDHASLAASSTNGDAVSLAIGAVLPANARIDGIAMKLATPFTGGSASAVTASVGTSADTDAIVSSSNVLAAAVDGQASTLVFGCAPNKHFSSAGAQLLLTLTPDVGHALSNLTAGSLTCDVTYKVLA